MLASKAANGLKEVVVSHNRWLPSVDSNNRRPPIPRQRTSRSIVILWTIGPENERLDTQRSV